MDIAEKHRYLALSHNSQTDTHRLNCYESLELVIAEWSPSTRISPIWSFSQNTTALLDHKYLVILGPVDPYLFEVELGFQRNKKCNYWLSLGVMNLIVAFDELEIKTELLSWAKKNLVALEIWELDESNFIKKKSYEIPSPKVDETNWRKTLSKLTSEKLSPNTAAALSEFAPLLASTLSRLEIYDAKLANSHVRLIDYVAEAIKKSENNNGDSDSIAAAVITTLNAGLSRFSSQSFSGVIPISNTESHFWVHSLFGIGIAGIGLSNLVGFISDRIGKAFIPNRLQEFSKKTNQVPNLAGKHSNDSFWVTPHLDSVTLTKEFELDPDITFFSGRDGFKAHLTNLSVPLTTVFSSNSEKWTLLTITHEISHKILKAVLSLIFPLESQADDETISKENAVKLFSDYLANPQVPKDWLDAIRVWLWEAVTQISSTHEYLNSNGSNSETYATNVEFLESVEEWYGEVEEIIVHVFDFLYFYRSEDELYLKEIWMTWSVIPNISNRVPEYVLRSVCAILAKNLHRGNEAIDISIERVKKGLEILKHSDTSMPYITEAIEYINESKELNELVQARSPLVRFVKTFLYSENIVNDLWIETRSKGGKSSKDRYGKNTLTLDNSTINNPLLFLEAFSTDKNASEARSMWIYYNLAFNVRGK
jgi:hypothetical protein